MTRIIGTDAVQAERSNALNSLYEQMSQASLFPFWAGSTEVQHDEIQRLMASNRRALPHLWSYAETLEPLLRRSAELVSTSDSERRSLILMNPGLSPQRATVSTLYTAYRLNDPNEVMPPHRHSPNAIRFGLIGEQNFTGVEGEDITFGPGDLVLTPHDTWHNHGNVGDQTAVTLSVLDLPLVDTLNSIYFEHDYRELVGGERVKKKVQSARVPTDYSQRIYGRGGLSPRFVAHDRGSGAASPMYVYRWEPMRELLQQHEDWDGNPFEALMVEYVDPRTGLSVYKTMTFFMQMLRPGEQTRPLKQNASLLVSPFQGRGHSIVDGKRFEWNRFDTLAVPGATWCQHANGSDTEPAFLFVASDEPTLKALGFYKKWGREDNGDVVSLI